MKVYNYLLQIPKGKVATYGQIALHLGSKGYSRFVGNVLHKNPDVKKYPCYKVVSSTGNLAENFAFGGKESQKKLLETDGIEVENFKVNLKKYQYNEKF